MGFGLPAAMGVQMVNRGATVACVTGEGSIQMNIQELSTCKQFHLPIKIIALNNGYLGMVRQWQEFFHGNRYSETYMNALPDFVKLAEAYGHVGMRIEKPADVEPALKEAFGRKNDLVFMDIKLPGENGLELTGRIKAQYPDMKIIILTSYDLLEYREAAARFGANDFLTKGSSSATIRG